MRRTGLLVVPQDTWTPSRKRLVPTSTVAPKLLTSQRHTGGTGTVAGAAMAKAKRVTKVLIACIVDGHCDGERYSYSVIGLSPISVRADASYDSASNRWST